MRLFFSQFFYCKQLFTIDTKTALKDYVQSQPDDLMPLIYLIEFSPQVL